MFVELDIEERERELELQEQIQKDRTGQGREELSSDVLNEEIYHLTGKKVLLAAEKGRLFELVKYASRDDLVNYRDKDNYTPLHRASYGGHLDCAKYLIRHGANIEAKTDDGWTPLHCAVRWNNADIAEYLLKKGADVNARSSGNNTPLHIVCSNGRYSLTCDIIQMLLFHPDCDYTIKNVSGDTAYDIAKRSGPFYRFWSGVTTLGLLNDDDRDKSETHNSPQSAKG